MTCLRYTRKLHCLEPGVKVRSVAAKVCHPMDNIVTGGAWSFYARFALVGVVPTNATIWTIPAECRKRALHHIASPSEAGAPVLTEAKPSGNKQCGNYIDRFFRGRGTFLPPDTETIHVDDSHQIVRSFEKIKAQTE